MTKLLDLAKAISTAPLSEPPTYSICTLVTREVEYRLMIESFIAGGFLPSDTEYLYVDNSAGNTADAFQAYNAFLVQARSPYIILCHQDVLLLDQGRDRLDAVIAELNDLDPRWGLFGNAGGKADGSVAGVISDPNHDHLRIGGPYPTRVRSLDENFIVTRKAANLALSHDLHGFHMYGTDLCVIADILGLHAYVVDFFLRHNSGGTMDITYFDARDRLRRKYLRALRSRFLALVTHMPIFLTGQKSADFVVRGARKFGIGAKYNR